MLSMNARLKSQDGDVIGKIREKVVRDPLWLMGNHKQCRVIECVGWAGLQEVARYGKDAATGP